MRDFSEHTAAFIVAGVLAWVLLFAVSVLATGTENNGNSNFFPPFLWPMIVGIFYLRARAVLAREYIRDGQQVIVFTVCGAGITCLYLSGIYSGFVTPLEAMILCFLMGYFTTLVLYRVGWGRS